MLWKPLDHLREEMEKQKIVTQGHNIWNVYKPMEWEIQWSLRSGDYK